MMVKQLVMLDTEFFTLFVQGRGKRPSHLLYEISYIVINDTGINQYNYYFQDLVHGGKVLNDTYSTCWYTSLYFHVPY